MRIEKPGKVTDRITLLGRNESCVYLVDGGEECAILGGGLTYIIPDVLTQLEDAAVDVEKIKYIVVHHAHFDHVGIVPFFKKRWPWIKVAASSRGKELLLREDVVETIVSLNRMLLPQNDPLLAYLNESLDIKTIEVEEVISEGDVLRCGDLELEVIDVPGHSSCSIAVYIPQENALSASDAGGIPYGSNVFAAANSNFDKYQESLEKMARYDTDVHLAEHYGALTGDEARGFMKRSIEDAAKMRALLEEIYDRTRDKEKTINELVDIFSREASGYFLPREVVVMVIGQMIRFIAKKHAEKHA